MHGIYTYLWFSYIILAGGASIFKDEDIWVALSKNHSVFRRFTRHFNRLFFGKPLERGDRTILLVNTMARPRGNIDVVCQNSGCYYYRKDTGKCIIKSVKCKCTIHHRQWIVCRISRTQSEYSVKTL